MSSVPEQPVDERDEADGVEPSDEDWSRLARVVARLLAGSWDREQAAAAAEGES